MITAKAQKEILANEIGLLCAIDLCGVKEWLGGNLYPS